MGNRHDSKWTLRDCQTISVAEPDEASRITAPSGLEYFNVLASDGKGSPAKLEVPLRVIEAIPNRVPSITSSPRKEACMAWVISTN